MKLDLDKLDNDFESFMKEAESVQKEVDLLHHQMNSTLRCMDKVNNKINKLKDHAMFDNLPTELKDQLFNTQRSNDEIKSKL
tara:strand:+ start:545 stop:790 length:246 start_codon:yes stop_codon:yes gene_type:complete